jgi:hypothetical protein
MPGFIEENVEPNIAYFHCVLNFRKPTSEKNSKAVDNSLARLPVLTPNYW